MFRSVYFCLLIIFTFIFVNGHCWAKDNYKSAQSLGQAAAKRASDILDIKWTDKEVVILTNAGYAKPGEFSTQGCLDGLAKQTGTSVGKSNLLSLQSRYDRPLWFAFYSSESGKCAYLEMSSESGKRVLSGETKNGQIFSVQQSAKIDAQYLFKHSDKFKEKSKQGLFGNNLFRVVTVANAAASDCPDDVLQAIKLHDHYCPGVMSGVLMGRFIQKEILLSNPDNKCFVLSLNPWCKEDALITLLNVTPGKRSYGVFYPEKEEIKSWPNPLDKASTIVFVHQDHDPWKGTVLYFDFAKAQKMFKSPETGNQMLDKLAMDLWFLDYLDKPEEFVSIVTKFELKKGQNPRVFLRPELNSIKMLSEKVIN